MQNMTFLIDVQKNTKVKHLLIDVPKKNSSWLFFTFLIINQKICSFRRFVISYWQLGFVFFLIDAQRQYEFNNCLS